VLSAPSDPAEGDRVGPDQLTMLIGLLRARADVVVLDTPTGLGESTLAALDAADHVVAVTQVDVPGVTNLQSFLSTLDQLGIDEEHRTVVLNKELANTGLTTADIEQVLGRLGGSVPFDPGVTRALNSGLPVCAAEAGHAASKAILSTLTPLLPAMPMRRRGRAARQAPSHGRHRRRWRQ
jgi:MinD-like ATPase involved in chromosome partitioning or flagellar assembly